MAHSVEMPELGESVTEGTITTWLKEVGDTVEVDEPLLEVSTDKVDTEIPSPVAGTLIEIKAEEDDTVEVGDVIAVIGEEGEDAPASDDATDAAEDAKDDEDDKDAKDSADKADDADKDAKQSGDKSAKGSSSGSTTDVEMPELGESVTEGTITTWLKSVGDEVDVDEPLLEVSTDKVDTEIPSPVAGTLVEILAEEDDTVEVGDVIAVIGDADAASSAADTADADDANDSDDSDVAEDAEDAEDVDAKDTPAEETAEAPAKSAEAKQDAKETDGDDTVGSNASAKLEDRDGKVPYVTPLVRKLAEKHGVDLSTVEGTGVGGRIRKQDVLAAAEGGSSAPATETAPAQDAAEQAPQAKAAPAGARANWSTQSVDPGKQDLIGTTQKLSLIHI